MNGAVTYRDPGVYFGLPESDYLADPALSNSGIQNLRVSPLTYWVNSPLNPAFEPEETDAKSTGRAFHKRILEGKAAFDAAYAPELDKADYPDALKSGEELRAKCQELGLPKSGTLAELVKRIRAVDPEVELWHELEAEWLSRHGDKEFLPVRTIQQIELAAGAVEANPATAELLRGGYPEVSIFWIDPQTGVRIKARIDYLTFAAIVDLKTFSNSMGRPLGQAVVHSMANYGYGIQAVTYMEAVRAALELVRVGLVFGEVDRGWLDRFLRVADRRFVFVFQETGRVPNVAMKEFNRNTNFYDITKFQYEAAVHRYKECTDRWGFDKPWMEAATIELLQDEDFPLWVFQA
jgi:hypothetical protein